MTYSSCLHDQQDLCWGNTSRDTSEESQESQGSGIGENDVRETVGRRNNRKLNLFSMHFVRNNEEIHLPFKNSTVIQHT